MVIKLELIGTLDNGPVKVNQKMAFFRFEMDFFRVFKFSLCYNLEIENPSFETRNSSFKPEIQFRVFSAIADCYSLVFYSQFS